MSHSVCTTFSLSLPSTYDQQRLPVPVAAEAGGQQSPFFRSRKTSTQQTATHGIVEHKIELTYVKLGAAYYSMCSTCWIKIYGLFVRLGWLTPAHQ